MLKLFSLLARTQPVVRSIFSIFATADAKVKAKHLAETAKPRCDSHTSTNQSLTS